MKKTGFIEGVMRSYRIMFLLVGLLIVLGVFALVKMPKQEFPTFTIRQGVVVGVYPGATSAQVEEQLAKPLERFLFTYKEINKKKTYTMSRDGIVYAMVELADDVHNKDEVWSKIKHGLASFKTQLPPGVLAVIAKDDFGDTSALLIALESDTRSYRELEDYLEILEGRLRRIESVSNLRRYGIHKEQITVHLDRDKLAAYGLDYKFLGANLFSQGFTTASGKLETGDVDMPVYISPVFDSEKEIAEQIVYSDPSGNIIRLRDVARIERGYDDPDSYILNNGKRAIILSLEMREGNNIVAYGQEVDEVLEDFYRILPPDIAVERIADQPKVVSSSVLSFLRDLVLAIAIVILVMIALFPLRSAIVAATTIPITVFVSLGIMFLCGIPLNTVTLAVLIVVLGMIVDNSIVVIDGYLEYIGKGMSRWHAAVMSARNYSGSIFLATLSLCIIFFPLLFLMTGLGYDFVRDFPWTFAIALGVSFLLAMLYIPFMEFTLIKRSAPVEAKEGGKKKFSLLESVQGGYDRVLEWTFRHPYLTLGTMAVIVVVSIVGFFNLDRRMFPRADRDQFAVEIYLPYGSPLEKTEAVADSVYRLLMADRRVHSITSFIGSSSPRFQASYAPNIGDRNYAQFIVNTESNKATLQLLDEYAPLYRDHFPDAYVKFKQLDYQQVQIPIEVRLRGGDIGELKSCADSLMAALAGVPGLVRLHTNYEESLPGLEVNINTTEASRLGVARSMAELEIAGYYTGLPVGTVWEADYPVSVVLKTDGENEYDDPSRLGDRYIATAVPGISVPLRQIADISPVWNEGQIVRRNGVRTVSVLADVERGVSEMKTFTQVRKVMNERIAPTLPATVEYEYGGMYESERDIISPIVKVVIVAIFLIFMFLVISFKKIGVSAAALLSLLFAIPGTVFGLWVTGTQFSLTCVLGIVSLFGIIIRNAIMMFEHAENLRVGMHLSARQAAFDAGKRRMVPIFLTSATTAVGIVPMIVSRSMLWTPMGIVIFWGTCFALVLVVTVLPVTYWKIFEKVKVK